MALTIKASGKKFLFFSIGNEKRQPLKATNNDVGPGTSYIFRII
jgi:hypothetical protein